VSRGKLPWESLNWWPIVDAVAHRSERTGSDTLAQQDFNEVLKAGRLRAMVRRHRGPRELLAAAAWDDFHIVPLIRIQTTPSGRFRFQSGRGAVVWSRKLGGRLQAGQWFFVWKPDYEKIFGAISTVAQPPTSPQQVSGKRGRKPVHDRGELQAAALALALARKQGAPEKRPAEVVIELREWCKRNKRKVPADSTLYEIAAAAFRIKPTLKR
jgi:hypothetical protein